MNAGIVVLKLGGELIETPDARARLATGISALARTRPVVVVHGGGQAIDAELRRRGVAPRKVDGLRITDADTLDAVVAVLGGTANTELVASLVGANVRAVGLTGVDAASGRATRALPVESTAGELVDLGLVGDPTDPDPSLCELLLTHGYVPVIASLGIDNATRDGSLVHHRTREAFHSQILNVNADVMACRLAAALGASDLIIAGTTPGVLNSDGTTLTELDHVDAQDLIACGTANAGMIAKLRAAINALEDGVTRVRIVDGRAIAGTDLDTWPGTTMRMKAAAELSQDEDIEETIQL